MTNDTEHIEELVLDGEFAEAFKLLPEENRTKALAIHENVRSKVSGVLGDMKSYEYKTAIIDALGVGELQQAADLLALSDQIKDMLKAENRAKEEAEKARATQELEEKAAKKKEIEIQNMLPFARALVKRIANDMVPAFFTGVPQKNIDETVERIIAELASGIAARFIDGTKRQDLEAIIKNKIPKLAKTQRKSHTPQYFLHALEQETFAKTENSKFSPASERLAKETFHEHEPHLSSWLQWIEHTNQIPSVRTTKTFVDDKIRKLKRSAQENLKERPPMPLTAWQSNAYYHAERYQKDMLQLAESHTQQRSFGHLIEFIAAQILDIYKSELGISRVMKSSIEEDLFRSSDIVFEARGKWHSLDLTTSTNPDVLQKKEEIAASWHGNLDLPNLKQMLFSEDIEPQNLPVIIPHVQIVNAELFEEVAWLFLERIKQLPIPNEKEAKLVYPQILKQVWEKTAASRRKDPVDEARDIIREAA